MSYLCPCFLLLCRVCHGAVAEPALDSFVFCRIQDDLGEVQMDDRGEQQSTLNKGDVHVLRYRPIRQLVADGVVDLM